jgi:hypothetical protein
MRWEQGRAQVDKLITAGELQRVPASREHADQLLAQARKDLASAELLSDDNPKRAYESLYDAARMALTAVLENEGLRPTSHGGHIAPYTAVSAQLDPPVGSVLRPFGRMRWPYGHDSTRPGNRLELGLQVGDLVHPVLDLGVGRVLADAADGPAQDLRATGRDARGDQRVHGG